MEHHGRSPCSLKLIYNTYFILLHLVLIVWSVRLLDRSTCCIILSCLIGNFFFIRSLIFTIINFHSSIQLCTVTGIMNALGAICQLHHCFLSSFKLQQLKVDLTSKLILRIADYTCKFIEEHAPFSFSFFFLGLDSFTIMIFPSWYFYMKLHSSLVGHKGHDDLI